MRQHRLKLDYKNALITGASSGLGRGLARYFAERGVRVYAAARRTHELNTLKAEVTNGDIVPLTLDVADAHRTHDEIAKLDSDCGGLDLVIANAGIGVDSHGKRFNWPQVAQMLQVNVMGAVATLSGALPGMVSRGRGHLVGISSLAAYNGLPRIGAYAASKAFLATFLQGLRFDVEKVGLFVTTIHPGYVRSEITAKKPDSSMPFLLETDDAVGRMGKAIERKAKTLHFPWQLALGVRALAALPQPLFEVVGRKVR